MILLPNSIYHTEEQQWEYKPGKYQNYFVAECLGIYLCQRKLFQTVCQHIFVRETVHTPFINYHTIL